jgi:hypothetical protein
VLLLAAVASASAGAVASARAARAAAPVLVAAVAPASSSSPPSRGKYIDKYRIFRKNDRVPIKKTWSGLEGLLEKEGTIVVIWNNDKHFCSGMSCPSHAVAN